MCMYSKLCRAAPGFLAELRLQVMGFRGRTGSLFLGRALEPSVAEAATAQVGKVQAH